MKLTKGTEGALGRRGEREAEIFPLTANICQWPLTHGRVITAKREKADTQSEQFWPDTTPPRMLKSFRTF